MRKIIFFIIFVNIYHNNFAQNNPPNAIFNYWYYRDRLKYFVVPGAKQGESQVINIRNTFWPNDPNGLKNYVSYGQEQLYFGMYLGTLATEYELLRRNKQDYSVELKEIGNVLDQFDNYLDRNDYWGDNRELNGFFIRENVPCDFLDASKANGINADGKKHIDLLNQNLTNEGPNKNVWDNASCSFFGLPRGHPGWIDQVDVNTCSRLNEANPKKEAMSQDEAIHLLLGLALVKKFCPEPFRQHSIDIACRVIKYIQKHNWLIYTPDDKRIIDKYGGNALAFSYAFVKAAMFFDEDCVNTDALADLWSVAWFSLMYWGIGSSDVGNAALASTLAAIGDSWDLIIKVKFKSPCCGHKHLGWCCFYVNSTTKLAETPNGINKQCNKYDIETYYLLLWAVLHDTQNKHLSFSKVQEQINGAPCEGPYKYYEGLWKDTVIRITQDHILNIRIQKKPQICSGGGWASDIRWEHEQACQNGLTEKAFKGNFNGLDFMLFYNLYRLAYDGGQGSLPYKNYMDSYITGLVSKPTHQDAINTITSTQTINANVNRVTYRAGEKITLKTGFKAQAASVFHAYIEKVNGCNAIESSEKKNINPVPVIDDIKIDTIPCFYDDNGNFINNDTLYLESPFSDTTITIPYGSSIGKDTTLNFGPYTYKWDFGNGQSAGTKSAQIIYTKPGIYKVQHIVTNLQYNFSDTINFTLLKLDCKDKTFNIGNPLISATNVVQSDDIYDLSILPNPNNGNMNVDYTIPGNTKGIFEIYNLLGKKIFSSSLIGGHNYFKISETNFENGIYYYRAFVLNKQFTSGKIIVFKK